MHGQLDRQMGNVEPLHHPVQPPPPQPPWRPFMAPLLPKVTGHGSSGASMVNLWMTFK
jgi:hypothetical protein